LTSAVESATSQSVYHALYLLPLNHIGLIAQLQSAVSSMKLECVNLKCQSGCDSLVVHRADDSTCCCAFSVGTFAASVEHSDRFRSLCGLIGETFSCVLRVASSDFGLFKFAATCADAAMDSGSFGTRFQCWAAVTSCGSSSAAVSVTDWTLFRASDMIDHFL
jgi:hypothetical protein